jgi:hypothetical protein
MTDWFYKAAPTKVSFEDTRSLAVNRELPLPLRVPETMNGSQTDNTRGT